MHILHSYCIIDLLHSYCIIDCYFIFLFVVTIHIIMCILPNVHAAYLLMNSIVIPEILCNQVREVITSLNNFSSDHDKLPPYVAKTCMEGLIQPITYLVNESLKSGIFPSELKLARVVLIFKSGDPSLLTNYRPIYVLSFFSKTF